MTKDIDDISARFSFLKEAAQECLKNGGEFPSGIEEQTDIRYFNDLLDLYDRIKRLLLNRNAAMAEGAQMRANYIEQVRTDMLEQLKIERSGRDYLTADAAFTKLYKEFEVLTWAERFEQCLEVLGVVERVTTRLIREKFEAEQCGISADKLKEDKPTVGEKTQKPKKYVAHFVLEDESVYSVSKDEVKQYKKEFPDVDILGELQEIQYAFDNHPEKRIALSEVSATILEHLKKKQDERNENND